MTHSLVKRWWPFVLAFALQGALFWGGTKWWTSDDPQLLKHAINHRYWELFFSPTAWRQLTDSNLTPWISLSFKVDWDLFGLSPRWFYLHQFVSLSLALLLLFGICRIWFTSLGSLTALLVFAISRPMLEVGDMLMLRHYLEGLVFSLGATLCFIRSMEGKSQAWSVLAVLLYVVACTAKEIYVPLPFCLIMIPLGDRKARLSRLWPMFAVIPLYTLWRYWMLGGSAGGYGVEVNLHHMIMLPSSVLAILGWHQWLGLAFAAAVALVLFVASKRGWVGFVFTLVAVVILPLIPVSSMMAPRYGFLPSLLIGLMLGWCVTQATGSGLNTGRARLGILLVVVVLGHLGWRDVVGWRSRLRKNLEQARVEGHYLLFQGNEHEFIKDPAGPPWFYQGLAWLRIAVLQLHPGPQVFMDPIGLLEQENYDVLVYNPETKRIVKVKDYAAQMRSYRNTIRPHAQLRLILSLHGHLLKWDLGPWKEGSYAFLWKDKMLYGVPRQGRRQLRLLEDVVLRVRYSAPEGWVTYSPPVRLEVGAGAREITWQR